MQKTHRHFIAGEVMELADLTQRMLNDWVTKGVIVPTYGGRGTGSQRQFSLMQTVGICIGAELRNSEQGSNLEYVRRIVEHFAAMPEEELLKVFKKGKTFFLIHDFDHVIFERKMYSWQPDVKATYERCVAAL